MRKSLAIILTITVCSFAIQSCKDHAGTNDVADLLYSDTTYWYDNGREVDESLVDVFYILPTCVFDWTDSTGQVCRYASLTDEVQRRAMRPSYSLADEIFADSANFFAPYYRHISLDVWMEGEDSVKKYFPHAMDDIRQAFDYYMTHHNNGRPFILAGFSQGAKCVVELIKGFDQQTASRLVAAYVCGYRVTDDDIQASPYLLPANGIDDTGVTIAYNTVSDTSAISPVISAGNRYVINPVSWSTSADAQQLSDSISISIDSVHQVLMAQGIDPSTAYNPRLASLLPLGNLHLLELTLYKELLKENVKRRIRKYNN